MQRHKRETGQRFDAIGHIAASRRRQWAADALNNAAWWRGCVLDSRVQILDSIMDARKWRILAQWDARAFLGEKK